MSKTAFIKIFAWGLSAAVIIIAFVAWGQGLNWKIVGTSSYNLFPLFGLLAFSLMWTHYVVSAVRQYIKVPKKELKLYIEVTSWAVLLAIIAHPGLLEWQLWRDGFGLPPGSVLEHYVNPALKWAVLIGFVSLLIFIVYEFRRKFASAKWWKYIVYLVDAAMVAIFVHGLNLGADLQTGWLKAVWFVYGATLFMSLMYIYYRRFNKTDM